MCVCVGGCEKKYLVNMCCGFFLGFRCVCCQAGLRSDVVFMGCKGWDAGVFCHRNIIFISVDLSAYQTAYSESFHYQNQQS